MAVADLTMYGQPEEVHTAYRTFVEAVAQRLGITLDAAPAELTALWMHPNLLLAQTCGYPWVTQLRDKVSLVAAPRYTLPGCENATHCSFILVPESSDATRLEQLRHRRVVINSQDSNSGMNLLRHTVAPLAKNGRFFGQVLESGGHVNSMTMLQQGLADVAAVDAVTYGYLNRDQPDRVAGLRVLQCTRLSPSLPIITAATRSDAEIRKLHEALEATLQERPALAATLAIQGFDLVDASTYMPVLEWEQDAIAQGYPVIA